MAQADPGVILDRINAILDVTPAPSNAMCTPYVAAYYALMDKSATAWLVQHLNQLDYFQEYGEFAITKNADGTPLTRKQITDQVEAELARRGF